MRNKSTGALAIIGRYGPQRGRRSCFNVIHLFRLLAVASFFTEVSAALDYGWVNLERLEYCKTAPIPLAKLDETTFYPRTPYNEQPNAETRALVQEYRSPDEMKELMQTCSFIETDDANKAACQDLVWSYIAGIGIWMTPAIAGCVFMFIWFICCWIAACRCCRRCCLCAERKGPRPAHMWQKFVVVVAMLACCVINFAAGLSAYGYTGDVSLGLNSVLCQLLATADETLNGSPRTPNFLGVDEGINRINMVRRFLDVDGRSMTDVRAILDETSAFSRAIEDLERKIEHMKTVLFAVGQRKVKDHLCWFCKRAVGDNATGEMGLLNELLMTINQSSANAMRDIQKSATEKLTGRALVDVSSAVQRGGIALGTFKLAYAGTWVDGWGSLAKEIKVMEDTRHTLFRFMCAFCVVHAAVVSTVTVELTRRSKAKFPSGTGAFCTWMCGFCAVMVGLLFAGGQIIASIPISELCHFWRYDLYTYQGISDYYIQLGLYDPSSPTKAQDPLAVNVWRTCFTPNGTGNVLDSLNLRIPLDFQRILDNGFIDLEDKMAGSVIDIAKFELLVSQSKTYGGLFLLDPDDLLPLDPSVASKVVGSSLDPDDQEGPDGESLVYGLNTYASLIAGPGKYAFKHGTGGGGILITGTTPTEEDVKGEPVTRQNVLVYARLKEQILSDPAVFRCDVIDASYVVTHRSCGFEGFKAAVLKYAEEVRDAGKKLSEETKLARQLIAYDLQRSLKNLMDEVKAMRETFKCRFLWKRWEDFGVSLCNTALPGMINGAAAWMVLALSSLVLLTVHYKMWRHLLDNRVVGLELEHFSKKYGYLAETAAPSTAMVTTASA